MSNLSHTNIENSQIKITGVIPAKELAVHRSAALAAIGAQVKIDGFRDGKAPESAIVAKVGEVAILDEMAQLAINAVYPAYVEKEQLNIIGYPKVEITKLAPGNDLEFTITAPVMPTIELADYKKLAAAELKNKKEIDVADTEVDEALMEIRKMRAHQKMHEDGVEHDNHDHAVIDEKDLPELTDEWVKELGAFENVDDLRDKIKANIRMEKMGKEHDRVRLAIMDAIIEKSKLDVPPILIESELARMTHQFEAQLQQAGMKLEDYLKQIDKKQEDLALEWKSEAEKRAKMQLVLNKIAATENITPDAERMQKEIDMIIEHHPNADKRNVEIHVETVLMNQAVFEFLESQGKKSDKDTKKK